MIYQREAEQEVRAFERYLMLVCAAFGIIAVCYAPMELDENRIKEGR